ncbi:MAG: hypothetical protein ACR2KV_17425 [Solirubrobacteraceae bacterium]
MAHRVASAALITAAALALAGRDVPGLMAALPALLLPALLLPALLVAARHLAARCRGRRGDRDAFMAALRGRGPAMTERERTVVLSLAVARLGRANGDLRRLRHEWANLGITAGGPACSGHSGRRRPVVRPQRAGRRVLRAGTGSLAGARRRGGLDC